MSLHLGDASIANALPSYCRGQKPSISYLYSPDTQTKYLFPDDPFMKNSSIQPFFKIKGKRIIFAFKYKPVLYYEGNFIYSIQEFLKRITLPNLIKTKLLNKIAIIAHYLTQDGESEYVPGTAKQKDKNISFLVKNKEGEQQIHFSLENEECKTPDKNNKKLLI